MSELLTEMRALGACREGLRWLEESGIEDAAEMAVALVREGHAEWLAWAVRFHTATRDLLSSRTWVAWALDCAASHSRGAQDVAALRLVARWLLRGDEVSSDKLLAAARAAEAAAGAATWAAWAAARAAEAAAWAVWAAARAAEAAWAAAAEAEAAEAEAEAEAEAADILAAYLAGDRTPEDAARVSYYAGRRWT